MSDENSIVEDTFLSSREGGAGAIDLRSDTVTRPTAGMYRRMLEAPLGDDGLDGDPTAEELEALASLVLGMEAGLFVPTCTMANLLAVLTQAGRGDPVLLDHGAHIYNTERGSSTLTGVCMRTLPGTGGMMDLTVLEETLALELGRSSNALVCLETSHNSSGGAILPLPYLHTVRQMANASGARVHLDGARLFNASAAMNEPPSTITRNFDTASICLSKGLSAPAGAVLCGSAETIGKARQWRKILGGTQRQVGVVAAAGIEALDVMRHRLSEDNARALRLSEAINSAAIAVCANEPQTNIVQLDVSRTGRSSDRWVDALDRAGLKVRPINPRSLRCVTHRHIDDAAIERAAEIVLSLDDACAP